MFRNFGLPELVLVVVLAVLIFGPGRIGKIGAELGKAIGAFKKETRVEEAEPEASQDAKE